MAFGDASFRSRAASLLRPSTLSPNQSIAPETTQEKGLDTYTEPPSNEKRSQDPGTTYVEETQSAPSGGKHYHSSGQNAVAHDRETQKIVRTIPAWVHTLDEDDEDLIAAVQSRPLIPPEIQFAQHNSTPSPKFTFRSGRPDGRRFDAQRGATPPLPTGQVIETGSRWKAFAEASAYPAISAEGRELVTEEWWARNGPDYSRPWLAGVDNNGDLENGSTGVHMFKAKRRVWHVRAQRTILRSPIVPMIIRIIVWFFSSVALGLASSIHHITDKTDNEATQTASTNMAIIVDAVAMVYLMYITYDEYSGKPLGLRPARAKMRLIFLDLFFIVFDSANLSLAFENIGSGFCTTHFVTSTGQPKIPSPDRHAICARQKGLASVLLIALIAWLLTFSISVLRLIERVTGG